MATRGQTKKAFELLTTIQELISADLITERDNLLKQVKAKDEEIANLQEQLKKVKPDDTTNIPK